MATISFSQRPQKNFYSYTSDGHIYNISASEPSEIKDGGGVWYCYFKCTPYYKIDNVTYPIFTKYTLDSKEYYTQVTSNNFYRTGIQYYYYKDKEYSTLLLNKYYTSSGLKEYALPSNAEELPQVTDESDGNTYYFDTLISSGDKYANGKFTATTSKSTDGSETTTYGDILMKKVQNSISINCFTSNVEQIPNYLKKSIESINYEVPDNYFDLYGQLFIEKLVKYMKEYGDDVIQKYGDGLTITTKVNGKTGTITVK